MGGKELGIDIRSKKTWNKRIDCLRYTLTSFTVMAGLSAVVIFAYCIWMKVDPKFYEWMEELHVTEFYAGVYVILFGAVVIIIASFARCIFVLSDNSFGLKVILIVDVITYLFFLTGSAVLLHFGTLYSPIQTKIKTSMLELISKPTYSRSYEVLQAIQESMGCCGANGANDYLANRHSLLTECRDSVTGSAYLYGCGEILAAFLGEKSGWLAGITMFVCALTVVEAVLTIILIKAMKLEKISVRYRR